jgi:hypothetical protein
MQYSLSLQHELMSNLVVEIGYAGAQGRNNWLRGDENQRPWVTLPDGRKSFPAGIPRRNPLFGDTAQPKVVGATTSVRDIYDFERDYSLSDFDARHNFVTNLVWELPFGPGRRWATGGTGLGAKLVEGWQLAGVFSAISGSPVNILIGFNRSRSGSTGTGLAERPDLAPGASQNPLLGTPELWFDPNAFVLQEVGTFGNLGKNTVTGPNLRMLDLSLSKMTALVGKTRLQIRAEVFNLLD